MKKESNKDRLSRIMREKKEQNDAEAEDRRLYQARMAAVNEGFADFLEQLKAAFVLEANECSQVDGIEVSAELGDFPWLVTVQPGDKSVLITELTSDTHSGIECTFNPGPPEAVAGREIRHVTGKERGHTLYGDIGEGGSIVLEWGGNKFFPKECADWCVGKLIDLAQSSF